MISSVGIIKSNLHLVLNLNITSERNLRVTAFINIRYRENISKNEFLNRMLVKKLHNVAFSMLKKPFFLEKILVRAFESVNKVNLCPKQY